MGIIAVYNQLDRLKIEELKAQVSYLNAKVATLDHDVAESHRIIESFRDKELAEEAAAFRAAKLETVALSSN